MSAALNALLSRADIWRGASLAADAGTAIATGHARLDRELPGGGWPTGALTEIISARRGIGEIGLLAPALARLTQAHRWIAWIAPPAQLHAPALAQLDINCARVLVIAPRTAADTLWTIEQTLRARVCAAVMAWPPAAINYAQLRRLQLAAEGSDALAMLYRAPTPAASPAVLRIELTAAADGRITLDIVKRRGGAAAAPITIDLLRTRSHAVDRARAAALAARRLRAGDLVN